MHKKDQTTDPRNYRPISTLKFFDKLFISILNDQVTAYLEARNYLSPNQFDCRKGTSTALALVHKEVFITGHLDKGDMVAAIYLDVEKCFDSVDPTILINKLRYLQSIDLTCSLMQADLVGALQQTKSFPTLHGVQTRLS